MLGTIQFKACDAHGTGYIGVQLDKLGDHHTVRKVSPTFCIVEVSVEAEETVNSSHNRAYADPTPKGQYLLQRLGPPYLPFDAMAVS